MLETVCRLRRLAEGLVPCGPPRHLIREFDMDRYIVTTASRRTGRWALTAGLALAVIAAPLNTSAQVECDEVVNGPTVWQY